MASKRPKLSEDARLTGSERRKLEKGTLDDRYVHIFTDGSASVHDGSGGWGTVLYYKDLKKEISGGLMNTTVNQMELTAILRGIQKLKSFKIPVRVYSDSQYSINCVTAWWTGWKRNGWRTSKGSKVLNRDLIEAIVTAVQFHTDNGGDIQFKWVRGHSGVPGNEHADRLAGEARRRAIREFGGDRTCKALQN